MMYNILLLETIAPEAMSILETDESVKVFFTNEEFDRDSIHGVMTRGKGRVNTDLIEGLVNLKGIARIGVGVDNVNVELATSKKIQVLNTPGENAATMAEHTLALILMLQRQLFDSALSSKQHNWASRVSYSGDEIGGKVLGIIGMGDIGFKVGQLAQAFGMEVIYWNRSKKEVPFQWYSMEEVAERADIISVHLPLTSETEGILGNDFLSKMKPGSLLVNTARGKILDEDALIESVQNGHIAGFAADVMGQEPPVDQHPLMNHPNTIITPHIGSLTKATFDRMCVISVKNLISLLKSESINPKYLYNSI